jgi:hypothetical protein
MRRVFEASAQDTEALGEQQASDLAQYFGASRSFDVCPGGDGSHGSNVGCFRAGSQRSMFGADGDCASHP